MFAKISPGFFRDQAEEFCPPSPIGQGACDRLGDLGIVGFLARLSEGGEGLGQVFVTGAFMPVLIGIDPARETRLASEPVLYAWRIGRAVQPNTEDTFETARRPGQTETKQIQN